MSLHLHAGAIYTSDLFVLFLQPYHLVSSTLSISSYFAYSPIIWCHLHFPFLRTLLTVLPSGAIYCNFPALHTLLIGLPFGAIYCNFRSLRTLLKDLPSGAIYCKFRFLRTLLTALPFGAIYCNFRFFVLCSKPYHLVPSTLPISSYFTYSPTIWCHLL